MPEMLAIDYHCRHCGSLLAVIDERFKGLSLVGLRDLVYVHSLTRKPECTVTYKAQPYDAWAATLAYKLARKLADDAIPEDD